MSISRGFHSLVETFLQAGISQEERNEALARAVSERNVDLVQLLAQYGADIKTIEQDEVFWTRHPQIIGWFVDNGMDLECNESIAKAFRDKQREFLGIYMGLRDRIPSARKQAAMALRYHTEEGNLKWVSLLLWAGADPRMPVPRIEKREWEEEDADETALHEAIRYGQVEVVKKIGIDPRRDDVTKLFDQHFIYPKSELIELLINKGADAARASQEPIESVFSSFHWSLDTALPNNPMRTQEALRCMEILASHGVRWSPAERNRVTWLRQTLSRISHYQAIQHLQCIASSGIMDQPMFVELMRTPKMREILREPYQGVRELRCLAGQVVTQRRTKRR